MEHGARSRARDFVTQNRMLLESDPVLLSRVHPMRRRLSPLHVRYSSSTRKTTFGQ